jgi:hypothetical protein
MKSKKISNLSSVEVINLNKFTRRVKIKEVNNGDTFYRNF